MCSSDLRSLAAAPPPSIWLCPSFPRSDRSAPGRTPPKNLGRFLRRSPTSPPSFRLRSPLSSFTTSSDAHTRQPLRTPLPTATFNTMYAQTLAGPLHKRASVSGPSVSEPLPRATGAGEACKVN